MVRRRSFILYVCAVAAVVYSLAPVYNLVSISLMDPKSLLEGSLFPPSPSLDNFVQLFKLPTIGEKVDQGLSNSLIIALLVMTITMLACVPAGYALGRIRMRGRTAVIALLLGTRSLPPVSVAMPYYLLFYALSLRGTIQGLVLVQLSLTIPIIAWVLMGFFGALPRDVEAQARVDGCSRFQAFRLVLLPLAAPGIAASAAISFLFSWNDFFYSWLLSNGTPAETYNTYLADFGQSTLFAAAVVVEILVAVVVVGFLQKYITSLKLIDAGTVTM